MNLDCCKYISAPSLSKDCALKFEKCKIEHIKDVSIFQFVKQYNNGWIEQVPLNPYVKIDDVKNETIAYNDISSQYPTLNDEEKLPYKRL